MHPSLNRRSCALFLTVIGLSILSPPTTAQAPPSVNPVGQTVNAASVFDDGGKLYVIGGRPGSGNSCTSDILAVDLTKAWTVDQPIYEKLPNGPEACFPTAVWSWSPSSSSSPSRHGQEIINIDEQNITRFDVVNKSWLVDSKSVAAGGTDFTLETIPYPGIQRCASVDPETGKIYIPGASTSTGGATLQYDPATGFTTDIPQQPNATLDIKSYSFVYSTIRKSFILFGGDLRGGTGLNPITYEFSPSSSSWSELNLTGDIPSPRKSHCMVSAYGGQKMILYGGFNTGRLSDIYILDINNRSWKAGTAGGSANQRADHVCAVSGDMFIAWGGQADKNVVSVYNLTSHQWTANFNPSLPPAAPEGPPPSTKSNKVGLAVGLSVGLVALVIIAIGFFLYRRRQLQRTRGRPETEAVSEHQQQSEEEKELALAQAMMVKEDETNNAATPLSSRALSTLSPSVADSSVFDEATLYTSSTYRSAPRNPHTTREIHSGPVAITPPGPQAIADRHRLE